METVAVDWCDHLLAALWDRVGAAGTAVADPYLLAEIARHEAEVRAWLGGQGLALSRQSIAGYAAVLLAAAQRCNRILPADPHSYDWSNAEWYEIRLLALCTMARPA